MPPKPLLQSIIHLPKLFKHLSLNSPPSHAVRQKRGKCDGHLAISSQLPQAFKTGWIHFNQPVVNWNVESKCCEIRNLSTFALIFSLLPFCGSVSLMPKTLLRIRHLHSSPGRWFASMPEFFPTTTRAAVKIKPLSYDCCNSGSSSPVRHLFRMKKKFLLSQTKPGFTANQKRAENDRLLRILR